jgi:2-haloacid dehalogenase
VWACCPVPCVPQAWKPFSSSYGYAVKQLGVAADKVVMVASHPWDIAGAMQVGALYELLCTTRSDCPPL